MQPLKNSRKPCLRISPGKIRISYLYFSVYRFAVFELEYTGASGAHESKIIFILYVPDVCDSSTKFIYATSKDVVRKKVQPFNKEVQVNDWADLDDEAFLKYFKH